MEISKPTKKEIATNHQAPINTSQTLYPTNTATTLPFMSSNIS